MFSLWYCRHTAVSCKQANQQIRDDHVPTEPLGPDEGWRIISRRPKPRESGRIQGRKNNQAYGRHDRVTNEDNVDPRMETQGKLRQGKPKSIWVPKGQAPLMASSSQIRITPSSNPFQVLAQEEDSPLTSSNAQESQPSMYGLVLARPNSISPASSLLPPRVQESDVTSTSPLQFLLIDSLPPFCVPPPHLSLCRFH